MMRLQHDYDSIPRHRRIDADPFPVDPAPTAAATHTPAPRVEVEAAPLAARTECWDDAAIPRASRTGIAPAPVTASLAAPSTAPADIHTAPRATTATIARTLRTMRHSIADALDSAAALLRRGD